MATITDYGTLKAEIQVWAVRPDTTFGNRVPGFVEAAETRLYYGAGEPGEDLYSPPLRSSVMETTGTVTLTRGVGTMPANALHVRKIYRDGDRVGLTYKPPEQFAVFAANNTAAADGIYYTIEDGELKVSPTSSDDVLLSYYQSFDPITTTNTTGPLLAAHGSIYLAACLFEAFTFLQEGQLAGAHLARMRSLIAGANKTATALRTSGPLRVKMRNPIP